MIPSRVMVLLALVPVGLAAMVLVDRTMLLTMLGADAVIALLAGLDALLAWRPLVKVSRATPEVLSIGRTNAVTLTLASRARRDLTVLVRDDLFEDATSEELPLSVEVPALGKATARYHVRPNRRGAFQLGDHHVRYRSPLGLWIRQLRLSDKTDVKVYPDVQAVRTYDLLAVSNREQSLFRSTPRRGGESEFERLREYRREDEFRAIDWKATARKGSIIAREYQLESNQSILFVIDGGRLMSAEADGLSLFDHALNATLMLAHVAARNGDNVGLFSFADEVLAYAPVAAGHRAAQRIVRAGYRLHPELVESSYRVALEQLSSRVRKRAMVVVFTQVVDDVAAAELLRFTRGLSRRHLPLIIPFRDPDLENLLAPANAREDAVALYTRAAAAEVAEWRNRLLMDLKKHGAHILDVLPRALTPALINRYLEIKARHLL
jgi:uncharacterized protein (DUF58 family)